MLTGASMRALGIDNRYNLEKSRIEQTVKLIRIIEKQIILSYQGIMKQNAL